MYFACEQLKTRSLPLIKHSISLEKHEKLIYLILFSFFICYYIHRSISVLCFGKKGKRGERGVSYVSAAVKIIEIFKCRLHVNEPCPLFLFCMLSLICLLSYRSSPHVERERKKYTNKFPRFIPLCIPSH